MAHPNTKPALPLTGKRPKQQQSRPASQRQHAFHTYQVPGTSSSAPTSLGRKRLLFYTTTNAKVSVDTIYDLRVAQLNKKKGANEVRIFACVYIYIYIYQAGSPRRAAAHLGSALARDFRGCMTRIMNIGLWVDRGCTLAPRLPVIFEDA